jgi:uncharacterized protein involved in exopolysaccharide biosynthesis
MQINRRRENAVRLALERQKNRILERKHEHDQAAVLQNEVTTAQRDLDAVTQRYAVSSLESQARQTNLVPLSAATQPFKSSSPKLLLHLLAGIFIGSMAGVAMALVLELIDPRVHREKELLQILDVPVLAKIGSMKLPALGRFNSTVAAVRLRFGYLRFVSAVRLPRAQ